jgi:hypothetical protein
MILSARFVELVIDADWSEYHGPVVQGSDRLAAFC